MKLASKTCAKLTFDAMVKNQDVIVKKGKDSIISVLQANKVVDDAAFHLFVTAAVKDGGLCKWKEDGIQKCICKNIFWDVIRGINNNFNAINEYIQFYDFKQPSTSPLTHHKDITIKHLKDNMIDAVKPTTSREETTQVSIPLKREKNIIKKPTFNFELADSDINFWVKLIPMVIEKLGPNDFSCDQCLTKKRKIHKKVSVLAEKEVETDEESETFYSDSDGNFDEIIMGKINDIIPDVEKLCDDTVKPKCDDGEIVETK
jgi:hypothetical protein